MIGSLFSGFVSFPNLLLRSADQLAGAYINNNHDRIVGNFRGVRILLPLLEFGQDLGAAAALIARITGRY